MRYFAGSKGYSYVIRHVRSYEQQSSLELFIYEIPRIAANTTTGSLTKMINNTFSAVLLSKISAKNRYNYTYLFGKVNVLYFAVYLPIFFTFT